MKVVEVVKAELVGKTKSVVKAASVVLEPCLRQITIAFLLVTHFLRDLTHCSVLNYLPSEESLLLLLRNLLYWILYWLCY